MQLKMERKILGGNITHLLSPKSKKASKVLEGTIDGWTDLKSDFFLMYIDVFKLVKK